MTVRPLQELHAASAGRCPAVPVTGRAGPARRGIAAPPVPRRGGRRERAVPAVLLPPVALATRGDAEVAIEAHLRAMRALQARPAVLRALPAAGTPPDRARAELFDGLRFPHPFGSPPARTRTRPCYPAFAAHSRLRLRRGRHGHRCGRRPATRGRGCPRLPRRAPGQPDGLHQRGARGGASRTWLRTARRRPCRWGSTSASRRSPPTRRPRPSTPRSSGGSRTLRQRTPTTSSSTSPRRTPRGCAALQEGGRLSAVLARGRRRARRAVAPRAATPPAPAGQARARPRAVPASRRSPSSCCTTTPGGLVLTNTRAAGDRPGGRERRPACSP